MVKFSERADEEAEELTRNSSKRSSEHHSPTEEDAEEAERRSSKRSSEHHSPTEEERRKTIRRSSSPGVEEREGGEGQRRSAGTRRVKLAPHQKKKSSEDESDRSRRIKDRTRTPKARTPATGDKEEEDVPAHTAIITHPERGGFESRVARRLTAPINAPPNVPEDGLVSFASALWNPELILEAPERSLEQAGLRTNGRLRVSHLMYDRAAAEPKPNEARARYISNLIGSIPDGKIPPQAPSKCPSKGTTVISALEPTQVVPKMLISPESPLKRLLVVQPPGAGKTCVMLDILSNYIETDSPTPYTIVIVGDEDVFTSVRNDLAKCPARYGTEGRLLRDRAPGQSPWCKLESGVPPGYLTPDAGPPFTCSGVERLGNCRIAWLDYRRFANWLHPEGKFDKWRNFATFESKYTVVLMDEVHKLTAPTEERATPVWKKQLRNIGVTFSRMGANPSTNPTLVGFTGTPIIDNPVQAICLATMFKGKTDPSIFRTPAMDRLKIPPKEFYTPEFVEPVDQIRIQHPGSTKTTLVSAENVRRLLQENRCIQVPARGKDNVPSEGHPCPISVEERIQNLFSIFRLKASTVDSLIVLFANLFFVTNNTADSRKYPELSKTTTLVDFSSGFSAIAEESLAKNQNLSWQEVSVFADPDWLRTFATIKSKEPEPLTEDDIGYIEKCAPKWKAIADALNGIGGKEKLKGKTAIYQGARSVPGSATSNDYLICLSAYLRHKNKACHDGTKSPLKTPAVYILGDQEHLSDAAAKKKSRGGKHAGPNTQDSSLSHIRDSQLQAFNEAACIDSGGGNSYSILLLGYEGYKALDLVCCSNLLRTVIQANGKAVQTIGRAHRSCSFRRVESRERWLVRSIDYQFVDPACPSLDCDCILGSFYKAQSELENDVLRIMRGVAWGCTNFHAFSSWPTSTPCLLDAQAAQHLRAAEDIQKLFFCTYISDERSDVKSGQIKRGISGDISPAEVSKTSGRCHVLKAKDEEGTRASVDLNALLHAHLKHAPSKRRESSPHPVRDDSVEEESPRGRDGSPAQKQNEASAPRPSASSPAKVVSAKGAGDSPAAPARAVTPRKRPTSPRARSPPAPSALAVPATQVGRVTKRNPRRRGVFGRNKQQRFGFDRANNLVIG
jgi:hypothetical protein